MTSSLEVGHPSPHCDCSFQICWKRERERDTTGRRAPSEGKPGSGGVDIGDCVKAEEPSAIQRERSRMDMFKNSSCLLDTVLDP